MYMRLYKNIFIYIYVQTQTVNIEIKTIVFVAVDGFQMVVLPNSFNIHFKHHIRTWATSPEFWPQIGPILKLVQISNIFITVEKTLIGPKKKANLWTFWWKNSTNTSNHLYISARNWIVCWDFSKKHLCNHNNVLGFAFYYHI